MVKCGSEFIVVYSWLDKVRQTEPASSATHWDSGELDQLFNNLIQ